MIKNDVASFFYYMWNMWSIEECYWVFESEGPEHFWNKWVSICEQRGTTIGSAEVFFSELSDDNQDRLMLRATLKYNRRKRI